MQRAVIVSVYLILSRNELAYLFLWREGTSLKIRTWEEEVYIPKKVAAA